MGAALRQGRGERARGISNFGHLLAPFTASCPKDTLTCTITYLYLHHEEPRIRQMPSRRVGFALRRRRFGSPNLGLLLLLPLPQSFSLPFRLSTTSGSGKIALLAFRRPARGLTEGISAGGGARDCDARRFKSANQSKEKREMIQNSRGRLPRSRESDVERFMPPELVDEASAERMEGGSGRLGRREGLRSSS